MANNPIIAVDGASVPCPSLYTYIKEDVSNSKAGRTQDISMHKNRIGAVIGLELEWNNIPIEEVHDIMTAFAPEYVTVKYLDPYKGTALNGFTNTQTFFTGNQQAPCYNTTLNVWSLKFKIVSKEGKNYV